MDEQPTGPGSRRGTAEEVAAVSHGADDSILTEVGWLDQAVRPVCWDHTRCEDLECQCVCHEGQRLYAIGGLNAD